MATSRWDETWHRLRDWTSGSALSERLAAQVLLNEGFSGLDPSHPLGGKDGGRDAICLKDGRSWVMAVYFPRGQQKYAVVRNKFAADLKRARSLGIAGFAFVTNQELLLAQRAKLVSLVTPESSELFHLERLTTILDSPPMAVVRKQFLGIDYQDDDRLPLGGGGGNAPGAGGGGGAAIGAGARGGDGGPGGNFTFEGSAGQAPGAGGGGGGAVGDGAVGGQGGGGGEVVHVRISQEELKTLQSAEIRVGRGGENGGPGEDTVVRFAASGGELLKSITARGGAPGKAPNLSDGQNSLGRAVVEADVSKGLRVTSVLLAECVHTRNGLLYVLGAGWEHFEVPSLPYEIQWALVCTVSMGSLEPGTLLHLATVVTDPNGLQVSKESFTVSSGDRRPVAMPATPILLRFSASRAGVWLIRIVSGTVELAQLPIEIRHRA